MANLTYRQLTTTEDFHQAILLQRTVWGLSDADILAAHTLRVFTHVGGVVMGALDGENLVGFTAALPRRSESGWSLWSDMMGVHPNYQRSGIGVKLKLMQREWALAHDFPVIGWTFDPMQRGNANLNLRRLGATARIYHINLYGTFEDTINAGMRTDRLEVHWDLNAPQVIQRAAGDIPQVFYPDMPFLLRREENGDITTLDTIDHTQCYYRVEIPMHLVSLKENNLDKAREWQFKLSSVLQMAFEHGYSARDFVTASEGCWYVLGCE